MEIFFWIYVAYLVVLSVIAFICYGADKAKAKKGAWRTPEATLLGLGIMGGAVGALLAMKKFRHKTKHGYFWVVNIIGLIWQMAVLLLLAIHTLGA